MNPWWLGLAPAQATVACGEHEHRLRWEAGALRAIDHEDPAAERALAALGGERCPCVEVLDAWSRHEGDPRVLVLASRGPADPLATRREWTAQLGSVPASPVPHPVAAPSPAGARQLLRRPARRRAERAATAGGGGGGWAGSATLSPPPAGSVPLATSSESELTALLALGGGVQDRLVATVASAWAQRLQHFDAEAREARPTLHASMHGRLSAALRTWLGRADIELELDLIDPRNAATLTERSGVVHASLPFAWLAEVWSRGLALLFGRFSLAAATVDGKTWTLTTIGPDLGTPAPMRIELP